MCEIISKKKLKIANIIKKLKKLIILSEKVKISYNYQKIEKAANIILFLQIMIKNL